MLPVLRFISRRLVLLAVATACGFANAAATSPRLLERTDTHVVAAGDSLASVASRYGVPPELVAASNGLDPQASVLPDTQLRIVSRRLVPAPSFSDGVLVNVPQRLLFLYRGGVLVRSYPAAVGRPDWRTPLGDFAVINRLEDMDWYVPRSIQREMQREGKPVRTRVPPGPDNALGRHWIGLNMPGIGIHGTNEPDNVYGFVSHGCIRLHPDDIAQLFGQLKRGAIGTIAYVPLLLARDEAGVVWFEANPDAYDRAPASLDTVRAMAVEQGIDAASIDWARVQAALDRRDGQAVEVGLDAQSELRNLPGFMIPSGSNAAFSRRISAISTGDL